MTYNSINFIILYPLIFMLYHLIPTQYYKARNIFLLAVSYLLYLNWKPAYALILLVVTLAAFITALAIDNLIDRRKAAMLLGGAMILFPLLLFKYYNFINETVYDLLSLIGLSFHLKGLNYAIPVGISFFTFQALGYVLDVYYKRIRSEHNFVDFALFVSFFPSLVSGPVNKASLLLSQIKTKRPGFDYSKAVTGLKLMLWGMFMKVTVADRLGIYVDSVLPNYEYYSGPSCLLASLLYSIQLYVDFAGYSLLAIGVGKTLGFELTDNFRRPYFALSVSDFWRRWHISLSVWLRDYVYIPLGGSRDSRYKTYRNIFLSFMVSGIWHGASFTYIIWGCYHGFMVMIEKAIGIIRKPSSKFVSLIRIVFTFLLVSIAWLFFRSPDLSTTLNILIKIVSWNTTSEFLVDVATFFYGGVALLVLLFKDIKEEYFPNKYLAFDNPNKYIRWCSYIVLSVLILLNGVFDESQFIYSGF